MFQRFRAYVTSVVNRWFPSYDLFDDEDTEFVDNVTKLVCLPRTDRTEHDAQPSGDLLVFQTKAQREQTRLEAERVREQATRTQVREKAIRTGKLVLFAKHDPRLRLCCQEFFPHQPNLSAYLYSRIVSTDGSLTILRLICSELVKAFPNGREDVPVDLVEQLSLESAPGGLDKLVNAYWAIGGDKIRARARELGVKLQGEPIPEEGIPREQWIMTGDGSITPDRLRTYLKIFTCAHVMLLAAHDAMKRKHHAA